MFFTYIYYLIFKTSEWGLPYFLEEITEVHRDNLLKITKLVNNQGETSFTHINFI